MSANLAIPTPQWDQSYNGKSVENHQEQQGDVERVHGVTAPAPDRVSSGIKSLQGDNQVGYAQTLPPRSIDSRATPPTPAPSADLDYQHSEIHRARNREYLTHELSAALARSKVAPGGPTGEAAHNDKNDVFFEAEAAPIKGDIPSKGVVPSKGDQQYRPDLPQNNKQQDRSSGTSAGVASHQPTDQSGSTSTGNQASSGDTLANASQQVRGWTEESNRVIGRALELTQQYLESAKETAVASKDRVNDIDLHAVVDDAIKKASAMFASMKDNVASTATDVQHRLQESGLPQKVVDLEQEYAQLAAQGLMNARDVIADKVSTTSFEDVNNNTALRLLAGVVFSRLFLGIPLKWGVSLVALMALASYTYRQVHSRRHPGHAPVRPQIPRTGQRTVVPAGEFGQYSADTGAVQAAKSSVPGAHADSPSVETHYPRGRAYAASLDRGVGQSRQGDRVPAGNASYSKRPISETPAVGGNTGFFNQHDRYDNNREE